MRATTAILLLGVAVCAQAADPVSYSLRTLAGTSFAGDGGAAVAALLVQPEGLAFDAQGNLYIADAGDHRIRRVDPGGKISTVAGTGLGGYSGDGQSGATARVQTPYDVCVDVAGNLYIADLGNARIRKLSRSGIITTVAGGGTEAPDAMTARPATSVKLAQPRNLALDSKGNLFISDFGANKIYRLSPEGTLIVIAGSGEAGLSGDYGPSLAAKMSGPAGLALDGAGNLFVADSGNRRVRRISGQMITSLEHAPGKVVELTTPTSLAIDSAGMIHIADGTAVVTTLDSGGRLGSKPTAARTVTVNSMGALYVSVDRQVRRYDRLSGGVVAGSGTGGFGGDERPASEWRFNGASGVVRDSAGSLYIADAGNGRVRKLTPQGELSTVLAGLSRPVALAFDVDGRMYIAESGHIRLFNEGGSRVYSYGSESRPLKRPSGLSFGPDGLLYVADTGNNLIRKVWPDGSVATVAGGGNVELDTNPLRARLGAPAGITFDREGNLWFTEADSGRVRKLDRTGRLVVHPTLDLREPRGIRVDADGTLVVCDAANHRLVRIHPDGSWVPLAGSGDVGGAESESDALRAGLGSPLDLLLEPKGIITFVDSALGRVFQLTPQEPTEPPPAEISIAPVVVIHAATLRQSRVASGQIAILRGTKLVDEGHLLPAETEVRFDRYSAAVLAVKPDELIVQVPPSVPAGLVEVSVVHRGMERGRSAIEISLVAPGIFTKSEGSGLVLTANEDGSLNSLETPAARGSVLTIYGTGAPGSAQFTVEIGGYSSEIVWSGSAPGQPGLFQINVRAPSGFAPSGLQKLTVTADGVRVQDGLLVVTQ